MALQQLERLAGPTLIAGGLLWVAVSVASMILGMLTGKVNPFPDAHSPALAYVGIWLLPLGTLLLGTGLLGMFARLGGRARGLGIKKERFSEPSTTSNHHRRGHRRTCHSPGAAS
jgi:hypothetical protein